MFEVEEITGLADWKIDVAVLCIFFVRDDCFEKTFEAVRNARPKTLLLWQDGPRKGNEKDLEGIARCREIAQRIDWNCTVYRYYNETNYGCDPSTFYSHKWAFSLVDKCIVLEDDVVADNSFFYFCKEMLDRYENDRRINRICGMNNVPGFECPDSYFYSSVGSVWGWATWKRVAELWDEDYDFLNDTHYMEVLNALKNTYADREYFKTCLKHKEEGVPHWETIQTYARHMNSQLNIIPSVNLIQNIGLGENSTHSNQSIENVPKQLREAFYGESKSMSFPLKHPKYVMENILYKEQLFAITGRNNPWKKKMNKLRGIVLRLKNGEIKSLVKGFKKKLLKR